MVQLPLEKMYICNLFQNPIGFFFSAECKLKAIKKGYLNVQVPITLEEKKQSRSIRNITTPIRPSNIFDVFISFVRLYWEIYFSREFKLIKKIGRESLSK